MWDRANSSDTLLGTARVAITDNLGNGDANGWHRLVGTGGDQVRRPPPPGHFGRLLSWVLRRPKVWCGATTTAVMADGLLHGLLLYVLRSCYA